MKTLLVLIIFLSLSGISNAQGFKFYNLNNREMDAKTVLDITKDQEGFIWLATNKGLFRYDGYNYKNMLFNGRIIRVNSFDFGPNGNLWLAHQSGLSILNMDDYKLIALHSELDSLLKNTMTRVLYFDEYEQLLWIGAMKGLIRYNLDNHSLKYFTHDPSNPESLSHNTVRAIRNDNNGNLWVGTYKGLCLFNKTDEIFESVRLSSPKANEPDNELVLSINDHPFDMDKLLVGSIKGLYEIDINTKKVKKHSSSSDESLNPSNITIKAIGQLFEGKIPVGTDCGLNFYSPFNHTYEKFYFSPDDKNSLSNNVVWCTYQDKTSTSWFGTDNGICITDNVRNNFFFNEIGNEKLELTDYTVSHILDTEKELILGTNSGIVFFNKETQQVKYNRHQSGDKFSLSNDLVKDIMIDSDGILWVGTSEGLNYRLPGSDKFTALFAGDDEFDLYSNYIAAVKETQFNTILVSAFNGSLCEIIKAKDKNGNIYIKKILKNVLNIDKNQSINNLHIDKQNNIWVSKSSAGIFVYNQDGPGIFEMIQSPEQNKLRSRIFDITESTNKVIFAAQNGVRIFEDVQLTQNKLLSEIKLIYNVIVDNKRSLWFTSDKKLYRFNLNDPSQFCNYDVQRFFDFGAFTPGSASMTQDGKIMIGTLNGLLSFYPSHIKSFSPESKMLVTNLKINNEDVLPGKPINDKVRTKKQIHLTKEIELFDKDKHINIEFSSLNYSKIITNNFAYKLEGFDSDWNLVSFDENSAVYSNLKRGNYTFRVRAVEEMDNKTISEASLKFKVHPPWFASTLAFVLYSIFIFSSIFIGIKILLDEREIKQIKRLNQSKLSFFTNISHEFKTPLTLILLPLQNLKNEDFADSKKMKGIFADVKRNASKLQKLITQLMDFRKIEQAKLELHVGEYDFVHFAKRTFKSFNIQYKEKNINAVFESNEDQIPLYFDKDKMEAILCNLLSNAIKFTSQGGDISLKIKNLTDSVEVSVVDSGIGVSPENQKHIFDRFYQTKSKVIDESGTGIGLSLVKDYINLFGGDIKLTSVENEGSEFIISLNKGKDHYGDNVKFIEKKMELTSPDKTENMELYGNTLIETLNPDNKTTILIVEDEPEIRAHIAANLKNEYNTIQAANGLKAFEILNNVPITLVISDLMMPLMDGLELLKKMKENVRFSDIPFIFLTAKGSSENYLDGIEAGADAYIPKPFDMKILKAKAQSLINNREELKERYSKTFLSTESAKKISSIDETFINKTLTFIEVNISNTEFSVDKLCQLLDLSNKQVYRKIKSLTGHTPVELIKEIRLEKSIQYLEKGGFNVSEIAFGCGFSTPHYFSKCFKLKYGKSPSEYSHFSV